MKLSLTVFEPVPVRFYTSAILKPDRYLLRRGVREFDTCQVMGASQSDNLTGIKLSLTAYEQVPVRFYTSRILKPDRYWLRRGLREFDTCQVIRCLNTRDSALTVSTN